MLIRYHWAYVEKNETGEYVLKSEVSVKEWQGFAYVNPVDGEVWLPYPLWAKLRKQLENVRVTERLVRGIIKGSRTSRWIKTCGGERSIEMKNLVILDEAKVKEILGGPIEDFIVHREPECEETGGDL
jgi:hypothetical protein